MTTITRTELQSLYDFERENRVVSEACVSSTGDSLSLIHVNTP